ncbi:conjugative transposon protein TraM [Hymenobacter wooponensis]|uniref:Conjugative transposon protein TraM n=1 Tax=Hymenobacter wooponensis TaxID=1525360 RepID=A0A4Z0MBW7_9BACT|nr:conjugative transposon protein TraM [Hymenobacter wooponensis]TGD76989.1 conjugative transposon protein TraM [Hymenobacter wooponensis]
MEPITSPNQPAVQPPNPDNEQEQRPAAVVEKRTPTEILRTNWMAFAGLLLVLVVGGLFLWLKSAKEAAQQEKEPVAAASANIEPEIASPETSPFSPVASPSAQIEAQRRAEMDAKSAPATPTDEDVVDVFAVDTTGQALRRRRRAQAAARRAEAARVAAADVDTIETTIQDPSTGSYRPETLVVPRRRITASGGGSRRRSSSAARSLVPARDADGTPFETDPDVLAMLASSPPETRAAYERMTGKRYRDPNQTAQLLATRMNAPGMDGFNTVKVGGSSSRMMAQGNYQQQQQLTPDVFFKCVINGEQKVRTGSVVILRLLEDAVVSGVTFPKNMVFAAVATVGNNNVTLEVNRLGPTRVDADIYDFNYMPGIMIDPVKRIAKDASMAGSDLQQQTTQELSTAIDRSASAANSVVGVGGRVAATVLSRPKTRTKLRDVLLPDGYPILITTAAAGQLGPEAASGR